MTESSTSTTASTTTSSPRTVSQIRSDALRNSFTGFMIGCCLGLTFVHLMRKQMPPTSTIKGNMYVPAALLFASSGSYIGAVSTEGFSEALKTQEQQQQQQSPQQQQQQWKQQQEQHAQSSFDRRAQAIRNAVNYRMQSMNNSNNNNNNQVENITITKK